MNNQAIRSSGFVLMLMIVIMVVGAATYFTVFSQNWLFTRASDSYIRSMQSLSVVKQQLLNYAILQPELYQSDLVSNSRTYKAMNRIPGVGYFPCPDIDGDGSVLGAETSCGNPRDAADDATGFVVGYLPVGFTTRNIFFGAKAPKQYYYVVDERFVNGNNLYNNGSTGRYAPLNTLLTPAMAPDTGVPAALPDQTLPWISLDGVAGYVVLIIVPNDPVIFEDGYIQDRTQAGDALVRIGDYLDRRFDAGGNRLDDNTDLNRHFFSSRSENRGVNDQVIGITFSEWQTAMLQRLCLQQPQLDLINTTEAFWFNDYDAVNNPAGGHWRGILASQCGG